MRVPGGSVGGPDAVRPFLHTVGAEDEVRPPQTGLSFPSTQAFHPAAQRSARKTQPRTGAVTEKSASLVVNRCCGVTTRRSGRDAAPPGDGSALAEDPSGRAPPAITAGG